jgi:hypothetical protein
VKVFPAFVDEDDDDVFNHVDFAVSFVLALGPTQGCGK